MGFGRGFVHLVGDDEAGAVGEGGVVEVQFGEDLAVIIPGFAAVGAGHIDDDGEDGAALDMAEEGVSEADVAVGAFDEAGNVADDDASEVGEFDDPDLGGEGGEGVGGDFGAGLGDGGEEGGFSGVGVADEADIGNEAEFEEEGALLAGFAGLGKAGGLADGVGEVAVSESAAAAFAEDESLAVFGQVGDQLTIVLVAMGVAVIGGEVDFEGFGGTGVADDRAVVVGGEEKGAGGWVGTVGGILGGIVGCGGRGVGGWGADGGGVGGWRGGFEAPDESAAGDFDDEVLAGVAVHALAHAELAMLGEESGLVELGDEVVEVVVGLEDDITAAAAVAAVGAALGAVGLAAEGDAALTAVAGAGEDLDLVDEHGWVKKKGEAMSLALGSDRPVAGG